MRGDVTDVGRQTNNEQLKIELLSQWKLEAESRNKKRYKGTCFWETKMIKQEKKIKLATYFWQMKIISGQGPGAQAEGGGTQVS